MKKIAIVVFCLLLSASICFSRAEYSISTQTLNDIVSLKQHMDTYLLDAFRDSRQFGSGRKDNVRQILNYIVIISGKLNSLISILDSENLFGLEEQAKDLTPKEVDKFINYVVDRMELLTVELNKHSRTSHQALMIHHIERAKEFIKQTERLLVRAQNELRSF